MRKIALISVFLLCCGCGMLPITREQVDQISSGAGKVAAVVTKPIVDSHMPGLGESAAGVAGGTVAVIVAGILNALRKKSRERAENDIKRVVEKINHG